MAAKVQNSTDHRTARQYRPLFGDHNSVAHNVRLEIPILQVTTACNADIISNATIFINDGIFDVAILPDAGQWNSLLMGVLDFFKCLVKVTSHHVGGLYHRAGTDARPDAYDGALDFVCGYDTAIGQHYFI